ncbi:unnamed protein product [Didymodactylos carnosus]|uniref:G-protein coupled receptors family 1 profile domain-containing protein n=1 Tax=Didymodactylos carnosus TaxID=1234261 RepID=A0A814AJG8_9BILA|nr:unnamed protein product [Didymodactylos carnosus]CAF1302130.1 unnamed protein product [Didymodactylos carnosus]CAF3696801.1 unnamed protein product [Didymodactylos carnosus]CAF4108603.1 unnamed protein product [Didymodactylos carnosus]
MRHLSTCYYMGILAITDTFVLLLGFTVAWTYMVNRKWSLLLQSSYTCKLLSVLFYTVADYSVWLVVMMSIDRCIAVAKPLHVNSICTVKRAKFCVCLLAFISFLINVHFIFTHKLYRDDDFSECSHFPEYEYFIIRIWPWVDAAVYSVLPFILLLTMNLIIVQRLWYARKSSDKLQIYQTNCNSRIKKLNSSMSRKLTTMLLSVTFFFLFTSLPLVCLQLYQNIHHNMNISTRITSYLKPICETLQYSNHCVNFFLYAVTGKAFRHELKRLFHACTSLMKFQNKNRTCELNDVNMINNYKLLKNNKNTSLTTHQDHQRSSRHFLSKTSQQIPLRVVLQQPSTPTILRHRLSSDALSLPLLDKDSNNSYRINRNMNNSQLTSIIYIQRISNV